MAIRPNYTPRGFEDLIGNPSPLSVAKRTIAQQAVQPAPEAFKGAAPGAPMAAPSDPVSGDEYDQALARLTEQQQKELSDWTSKNEDISGQLALTRQIDDLRSRIEGYPAAREKAWQEYQNATQGGYLPGGSGGTAGGGVDANGNPVGGTGTGINAGSQGFSEPGDIEGWKTQLAGLEKKLSDMQTAVATGRVALTNKQKAYYQKVFDTVKALRTYSAAQAAIDSGNTKVAEDYNKQIDPYNASVDAYGNYLTDEEKYAKEVAQRQADLDAGKYKVDPFAYLRGGRSLAEIQELRKQINAGNAHPNMDVPVLRAAPTAVQRPGDAPVVPTLQDNAPDVNVDQDVAQTLGYKPAQKPKIELKTAKPVAETPQPEVPKAPEVNPEAKPIPVKNPGTVNQSPPTVQQPPSAAAAPATQQLPVRAQTSPQPAAPLNAATSLPQQTTGSVSGQAPNTGNNSQGTQSQPTPEALANPAPFKDPDKEENNKDKKWEL